VPTLGNSGFSVTGCVYNRGEIKKKKTYINNNNQTLWKTVFTDTRGGLIYNAPRENKVFNFIRYIEPPPFVFFFTPSHNRLLQCTCKKCTCKCICVCVHAHLTVIYVIFAFRLNDKTNKCVPRSYVFYLLVVYIQKRKCM